MVIRRTNNEHKFEVERKKKRQFIRGGCLLQRRELKMTHHGMLHFRIMNLVGQGDKERYH